LAFSVQELPERLMNETGFFDFQGEKPLSAKNSLSSIEA